MTALLGLGSNTAPASSPERARGTGRARHVRKAMPQSGLWFLTQREPPGGWTITVPRVIRVPGQDGTRSQRADFARGIPAALDGFTASPRRTARPPADGGGKPARPRQRMSR